LTGRRRAWSAANPGNLAARAELLAAIREAAAQQLAGGGDLLDCGCGTGWLLEALAAGGVAPERIYALDADRERIAAAVRRAPGVTGVAGDARSLPFSDRAFDAVFHVVSLSSMGPGGDVAAVLAESRRTLAPGGVLLVYESRFPNPFNRGTRLLRRGDLEEAGLPLAESRSLTLLPPLARRLGRFTPHLHRPLSALPPLRSHRLLVHRAPADASAPAARTRAGLPTR
jgi:SAM-dependent methyltransferase